MAILVFLLKPGHISFDSGKPVLYPDKHHKKKDDIRSRLLYADYPVHHLSTLSTFTAGWLLIQSVELNFRDCVPTGTAQKHCIQI